MPEGEINPTIETPAITKKETDFPKDTAGRMDAIIGSFNIPLRASTLLVAGTQENPTVYSLTKSLCGLLLGSEMGYIDKTAVTQYCLSLCKAGFLREESGNFYLTDAGKKYGMPAAAYTLLYQVDHGFSLYPIFGISNSKNKERKSPWTRAKVLKSLESGPKREADIISEGFPHSVAKSFERLATAGAIEYSSVTPQTYKTQVEYKLPESHPSLSELELKGDPRPELLKEVAKTTLILKDKNVPITAINLLQHLPRELRARWDNLVLQGEISRAFSELTRQGFLDRGIFKGGEIQSNATLSEKGRSTLSLIHALEEACQDGPALQEFQNVILPQVLRSLGVITRETADLYYPHSVSFLLREGGKKRLGDLQEALGKATQEGLTQYDIAKELGANPYTVGKDLRFLVKAGNIVRVKRNNVFYYLPGEEAA